MNIKVDDKYLDNIYNELLEGFIYREYQLEHPQLTPDFAEAAKKQYQNDTYFHNRVKGLVAGVMGIVTSHVE